MCGAAGDAWGSRGVRIAPSPLWAAGGGASRSLPLLPLAAGIGLDPRPRAAPRPPRGPSKQGPGAVG